MIGGLCTIVLGLFIGGIALAARREMSRAHRRSQGWPTLTATVDSMGRAPHDEAPFGTRRPVTTVSYRYQHPVTGQEVRGSDMYAGTGERGPGEGLTIAYDPENPSRSVCVAENVGVARGVCTVFIVIGALCALLGLVTLVTSVLRWLL